MSSGTLQSKDSNVVTYYGKNYSVIVSKRKGDVSSLPYSQ